MTYNQAVAILEAERILQDVGCEGPECHVGSAWHRYVEEAVRVYDSGNKGCDEFGHIYMVKCFRVARRFA